MNTLLGWVAFPFVFVVDALAILGEYALLVISVLFCGGESYVEPD